MAIDSFAQPPLRHLSTFISSGTFTVPEASTRLYVSVNGSQGQTWFGGARGHSRRGNGYVNVVPGKTAQVIIGAAAAASSGTTGGTTSFDGAIIVTGSQSGFQGRYGQEAGGIGTATIVTSAPGGAPAGAAARVTSASTSSQDVGNLLSGTVDIYG